MVRLAELFVAVVMACALTACECVRITEVTRLDVSSEGCPARARYNTKGDCWDEDKGEIVALDCCSKEATCEHIVTKALQMLDVRINIYMGTCGVQRQDMSADGKFTLLDNTRMCSETCTQVPELQTSLEIAELPADCNIDLAGKLLMMKKLASGLDAGWANCGTTTALPSTTSPSTTKVTTTSIATTTSIVTTTTGKALFDPIVTEQRRIVFVVDLSTSMKESTGLKFCSTDQEVTRLELLKSELIRVIKSLSNDQAFAIIGFGTHYNPQHYLIQAMSRDFLQANDVNKKVADDWVHLLQASGATPMQDALKKALKFRNIEAIHLLTDGAPTDCSYSCNGYYGFCRECMEICPHSRACPPIYTTLFMPGKSERDKEGPRALLSAIAGQTGGKFREPYPYVDRSTCFGTADQQASSVVFGPVKDHGVVFLIDVSAAMGKRVRIRSQGSIEYTTRLEYIKQDLLTTLQSMRSTQSFTIIGFSKDYGHEPRFTQSLVPVTPQNIAAAQHWLSKLSTGAGHRDIEYGLKQAFKVDNTDAVYLLGAGLPEEDWSCSLLGDCPCTSADCMPDGHLCLEWSQGMSQSCVRPARVPIHTLVFMPGDEQTVKYQRTQTLLREIARKSGGKFMSPKYW